MVADKPISQNVQVQDIPKIEKVVAAPVAAPKEEPKKDIADPDDLAGFDPKADLKEMTLKEQLVWNKKRMLYRQREREAREADPNYVAPERAPVVKIEKKPVEPKNDYKFGDKADVS